MRVSHLGVASLIACVLIACSSAVPTATKASKQDSSTGDDSGESGGDDKNAKSTVDKTTPAPSKAATPTTPAGGTGTGANACTTKKDSDACYTCCENLSADTKKAVADDDAVDTKYQTCACAKAKCATECKTDYCSADADADDDPVPGSACETCLDTKAKDCDDTAEPQWDKIEATAPYKEYDKCTDLCDGTFGDDDDDDQ